jgi:hypothetical protein
MSVTFILFVFRKTLINNLRFLNYVYLEFVKEGFFASEGKLTVLERFLKSACV